MNKINNQIRREEFDKRRTYKGKQSLCNGYECSIFLNCLLEINQLKEKLEEKNKVIAEAIEEIEYLITNCDVVDYQGEKIIKILLGGKNNE